MRPRYQFFVCIFIKRMKKHCEIEIVSNTKIKTNQATKQITQVQKITKIVNNITVCLLCFTQTFHYDMFIFFLVIFHAASLYFFLIFFSVHTVRRYFSRFEVPCFTIPGFAAPSRKQFRVSPFLVLLHAWSMCDSPCRWHSVKNAKRC